MILAQGFSYLKYLEKRWNYHINYKIYKLNYF